MHGVVSNLNSIARNVGLEYSSTQLPAKSSNQDSYIFTSGHIANIQTLARLFPDRDSHLKLHKHLFTFSSGPRSCMGRELAMASESFRPTPFHTPTEKTHPPPPPPHLSNPTSPHNNLTRHPSDENSSRRYLHGFLNLPGARSRQVVEKRRRGV